MSTTNDIDELTPELSALAEALRDVPERMPRAARTAVRGRIVKAARNDVRWRSPRLAFVRTVAAMATFTTLLGGVSYAAGVSVPGDALYGLKRGTEDMAVAVLPEGALERAVLLRIAERRAEEVSRLASGDGGQMLVTPAIERFRIAVRAALGARGSDSDDAVQAELRLLNRIHTMNESIQSKLKDVVSDEVGSPTGGSTGGQQKTQPGTSPSSPQAPSSGGSPAPGGTATPPSDSGSGGGSGAGGSGTGSGSGSGSGTSGGTQGSSESSPGRP